MGLPPEQNSRKPLVHADMISCKKLNPHLDEPLEEKTRRFYEHRDGPERKNDEEGSERF